MVLEDIPKAFGTVFASASYILLAAALSLAFFAFYVAIPILGVPHGSLGYYLASTTMPDVLTTAALSAAMALVTAMQVYAWRNNAHAIGQAGTGLAGFVSGSVSALLTSATCASCMSAAFSFIGFAGIAFLMRHRLELTILTFAMLAAALYLTSGKIARGCASCGVPEPQKSADEGEKREADERGDRERPHLGRPG